MPSTNLSETIEPEAGVTAETTAQEFIEGQQSNVYNRLHNNYEFWEKDIQSTSFVLDIVDSGYRLPFRDTTPFKCFLKNNKSALKNSDFVKTAMKQLLSEGKIEECASAPFCVNPLSVVEGRKKRLVIDLRHVNKFLFIPKFHYEDLSSLSQVFARDDWFFSWDLKSGYHHVNIYKPHQQYSGFSWVIDGVQRFFVFRVLPFGLAIACFCFTKLLRPFALRWRSMGHNCFIYINEGISGHRTKQLACIAGHRQQSDLTRAGFIFGEKCNWEPHQIGVWLGLIIDTIRFEFRIPQEKLDKLYAKLDEIIESRFASFRFTAKSAVSFNLCTLR